MIPPVLERVSAELQELGFNEQAESLRSELELELRDLDTLTAEVAPAASHLPGRCPQCGGPVQADEVEWIASTQALCDYCGSNLVSDE
jgi:hypothetical protein